MLESSCWDVAANFHPSSVSITASHNGWCRLREIHYRQIKEHQSKLLQTRRDPPIFWPCMDTDPLLHPPPPHGRDRHPRGRPHPVSTESQQPSADSKHIWRRPCGRAPTQLVKNMSGTLVFLKHQFQCRRLEVRPG